ncbi:hypothetical protein ABZ816_28335 [Actinosynnema sp. NPDC047251]|uniref:Uncharacterized protein n=1 Tax=Saccharothrix espanaensis (strain ATCC 51144 / DSM 44229 / JCM 9112 / NBRC 15066 / NRRL 15764) TaxID=1179773 RepID=K0JXE4_SACES|nr:hypothetical protein [Saccharothrix espanaensis]CCH28913.1 hypothetical protein BN6_15900 [Saccharothrix espanaensis DSM 44229]
MSWNDFYRRRDALDAVLRTAAPAAPLTFDRALFATEDELLLALHYRWMQQLTGRLGVALENSDDDRVEIVTRTWRTLAAQQPVLRAVLDEHLTATDAVEREQRLLALTAGLAELSEPSDEITRVGAAFATLIRTGPDAPAQPRKLAKSA